MFFQNFPGFPKDQIRKASANVNWFNGHVRYLNWNFLELLYPHQTILCGSGWWFLALPLWKMMESVGMMKFSIYGKMKNVPNNQPVWLWGYIWLYHGIAPSPYIDLIYDGHLQVRYLKWPLIPQLPCWFTQLTQTVWKWQAPFCGQGKEETKTSEESPINRDS